MKKMIQKIKENKLKSICIGLSAFLFGFITVSLFNNMNNTYAIDTSPVCPVGWYLDTWSSSDTACCPKNPEYKYGGKAYGGSCSLAGSIGSNYETCPYGTKGTAGSCWIASVQPEAPACYVCGGSSQGVGSYVWGNYSQSSACTKTSLTYKNCKAPTYSCWICDANSSGNREYKWATSAPSTSCSSGSWYKSSTITSSANCVAPTYSCWICDANSSGNREYKWGTSAPSTSCSSGSWYKSSTITSAANCVAPTTTTYTATFYANGGTFSDGSTTWSKTIYSGARNYFSQMGIPTLTKSGCTADGWYMTNASGTVYRQYFDTGDATKFYAHWNCSSSGGETGGGENPTPTTYTVKYDANGGTGAPSNQTKKQGESLTISTAKPTKTGYTFTSWNTKKDGTGTKYDIGASYTVDADLTLYAQYKENTVTYTVKYDANGGENAPKEQTKTKGKELVLSTIVPTKEGYTFDGWYDKKENGKEYDFTKEVTSDISLYAYWSKIGDKTNEDVDKNSKTGDILIFIAWTAGIGALTYSVYYFKSRKETI